MSPAGTARGLSATELATAVAELQPLVGATVLEIVAIAAPPATSDLLLILQHTGARKQFVLIALGSARAHVTITARRFGKDDFARGPIPDRLQQQLRGGRLIAIEAAADERRCEFEFDTDAGRRRLVVELFSARGLWALLAEAGEILALSRPVETAVRTLKVGDPYCAPPPAAASPQGSAAPADPAATRGDGDRFAAPILPAIDAFFAAQDGAVAATGEHEALQRAATRALQRAQAKVEGLGRQLLAADQAHELRARADLMLAYAHTVKRGAATMTVFDPESGEPIAIELDPGKPVTEQCRALYDKARRLTEGRAITAERRAEAEATAEALARVLAAIEAIAPDADTDDATVRLEPCRTELQRLGALPRPQRAKAPRAAKPGAPKKGAHSGENFRTFVSAEGYEILVGRNNQQNDRLTMRVANGNDLWLHVGGGRAGSHVVVRLPKHKTASLETLLDAGTLAVHFSKARGERRIDVIYTHKKNVRKPKGLPAGAVVPSQTRTLSVQLEPDRLQRLLDSAADDGD